MKNTTDPERTGMRQNYLAKRFHRPVTGEPDSDPLGRGAQPHCTPSSDEATALGKQGSQTHWKCLVLNKILPNARKVFMCKMKKYRNVKKEYKRVGGGVLSPRD